VEHFDILDSFGNHTGVTAEKGTKLHAGQYYLGTHAYVFNRAGEFLLQQRSLHKEFLPGGWDVHLEHTIARETSEDCVCRGLEEEIGLIVCKEDLQPAKRLFRHEINHITDIYFIQKDFDLNALKLNSDEVINVKTIPKNEMLDFLARMDYRTAEYRQCVASEINKRLP
jgi:isopentenyldiphosphate isomerase